MIVLQAEGTWLNSIQLPSLSKKYKVIKNQLEVFSQQNISVVFVAFKL